MQDRHHPLKAWIALILWLIVIAIESSNYLSSANTSRFLYPILHFLFGIDWASFEPYHVFIRKSGHVFGYGLLSILLFRAWRETLPVPSGASCDALPSFHSGDPWPKIVVMSPVGSTAITCVPDG